MPETRAVGLPAMSNNEITRLKLCPATTGAGMAAKLLIEAYPEVAIIVLLTISDPANETIMTIGPLTDTFQGMIIAHIDNVVGARKVWLF
jgi:hypothetical protein